MIIEYPSAAFPAQPKITLTAGSGWQPVNAPGCVLAAKGEEIKGYTSNVVVTCTRHPLGHELTVERDATEREVQSKTDNRVVSSEFGTISERPAVLIAATFRDEAAGPIAQFHVFIAHDNGVAVDVVHAVATASALAGEEHFDALAKILKSLQIA